MGGDAVIERLHIIHRRAVHRQHHITGFDAGIGKRTARIDILHQHAARTPQAQALRDRTRDGLTGRADPGKTHATAAFHALHYPPRQVGGNGETDPDIAAGARIDRGVDAGQFAIRGDQRAAGIAGIDGGVGLDEELIIIGRALGAGQRRDDAHGHGLSDAKRVADRQHQIAHLDRIAVAERHSGKALALGVDLEHRQVRPADRR